MRRPPRQVLPTHVYTALCSVVAGMLIAGLLFRLTDHPAKDSTVAAGAAAETRTGQDATGADAAAGSTSAGGGANGSAAGSEAAGGSGTATAGGGNAAAGGSSAGSGKLTASDVGVTADSIKLGIAILDLGATSNFVSLPGADPKQQRKTWQTFVDDMNAHGGIGGRKIVPDFVQVDVTDSNAQQAACVKWTETDHVFAVIDNTALMGPGQLCVAAEHHTIDIGSSQSYSLADTYQKANGLLITVSINGTRLYTQWARALERLHLLAGRTLGLIVDQGDAETGAKAALYPTLAAMGYRIKYTAVVSQDPSQGPAQATAHVAQMQAAGVDTVLDATSFVNMTAFVNQADKQRWKPQYLVGDVDGNAVGLFYSGMPTSWDGAVLVTTFGFGVSAKHAEDPITKGCRLRYNKLTGDNFSDTDANVLGVLRACTYLDFVNRVGTGVGPNLTRADFSRVAQTLGSSVTFPEIVNGSFGRGKTDYADGVRAGTWGPTDGSASGTFCNADGSRCFNDRGTPFNP